MKDYNKGLFFLPFGGTGEFGSSLNLYGCDDDWIIVDMGVSFGSLPVQEIIIPDPSLLDSLKGKIKAIFITHAHEDHYGALPYIWKKINVPVYGSHFSIEMSREKMLDIGIKNADLRVLENNNIKIGNFDIDFLDINHSVPEAYALVIKTSYGTIVHTGDWKMGKDILSDKFTNEEVLKNYGDKGVLALVSDSTNVMEEGASIDEETVRRNIIELLKQFKEQRVLISCFSSNITRLETFAIAAEAIGRKLLISGRSLRKAEKVARKCGYLNNFSNFGYEEDFKSLPREKVLLVCTGSQGERNSSLTKIASDQNPRIKISEGDVVIFSSKEIPGNERNIINLQNILSRRKARVIRNSDSFKIHSSGHAGREELRKMHNLLRPKMLVPVHGDSLHLREHAFLARESGVNSVVIDDGDLLNLVSATVAEKFEISKLAVDGKRLIPIDGKIYADKLDIMEYGIAFMTVLLSKKGAEVADISYYGLFEPYDKKRELLTKAVKEEFTKALAHLDSRGENPVETLAKNSLKKKCFELCGKKPIISVHVVSQSI